MEDEDNSFLPLLCCLNSFLCVVIQVYVTEASFLVSYVLHMEVFFFPLILCLSTPRCFFFFSPLLQPCVDCRVLGMMFGS